MIKKHLKTPLLLKQYFRKILKKNKYSFLKLLYQVKDYLFIKKIEKSDWRLSSNDKWYCGYHHFRCFNPHCEKYKFKLKKDIFNINVKSPLRRRLNSKNNEVNGYIHPEVTTTKNDILELPSESNNSIFTICKNFLDYKSV